MLGQDFSILGLVILALIVLVLILLLRRSGAGGASGDAGEIDAMKSMVAEKEEALREKEAEVSHLKGDLEASGQSNVEARSKSEVEMKVELLGKQMVRRMLARDLAYGWHAWVERWGGNQPTARRAPHDNARNPKSQKCGEKYLQDRVLG